MLNKSEQVMTTISKKLAMTGLLFLSLTMIQGQVWAAQKDHFTDPWQMKRLFAPKQSDLAFESKGHIIIYSGLLDTEVEKAMDLYFDRIDSMMFVRTIRTDKNGKPKIDAKTGEVVVADDGC